MPEEHPENIGTPVAPTPNHQKSIPANTNNTSSSSKRPYSLSGLFVIVVIIGTLVGLLIPALPYKGGCHQRPPCLNNQKQITLALLQYEAVHYSFPPAYIPDKNGKPMHSWRVLILPYLECKDLYDQYDFKEPWNSPHNQRLLNQMPKVFRCPNNLNASNCTSYAMLVGPHTLNSGYRWSLAGISARDGATTTLLLVEAADAKINWLEPRDLNVEEMSFKINQTGKEISSHHSGGAVVSFCDGHVIFLSDKISPETLKALTTVDGHEPVNDGDF